MNLKIGDVIKLNGDLIELISIEPHQDTKEAKYYKFNTGYIERDVRLHPEAVYRRVNLDKIGD